MDMLIFSLCFQNKQPFFSPALSAFQTVKSKGKKPSLHEGVKHARTWAPAFWQMLCPFGIQNLESSPKGRYLQLFFLRDHWFSLKIQPGVPHNTSVMRVLRWEEGDLGPVAVST